MGECEAAGLLHSEPRDPGVLLGRQVAWRTVPGGYGIEVQNNRSVPAGEGFAELAERFPRRRRHADLLPQLTDERLLVGLPGLEMPAEHVPHVRVELAVCRPPAEQNK